MVFDLARYDELIHLIYDAALNPSGWPKVMSHVCATCAGSRSLLYTPLHVQAQGGLMFSHEITQSSLERWSTFSVSDDPFARAALARGMLKEGTTFIGRDLVSDGDLRRSRLHREIWSTLDIGQVCTGVVFDGGDAHIMPAVVSVYRPEHGDSFDDDDVALLRRLIAHVSRSLGVMFHLRDHKLQAASNLAALDRLQAGVVLLDVGGAVQFANAAAERLMSRSDPLRMHAAGNHAGRRLRLAPRLHSIEESFQAAIARALQALVSSSAVEHFSHAVVLPDAGGKPSCVMHAAPLGDAPAFAAGAKRPRAILFLYDLAAASSVSPAVLRELFGLTPAEARTALQLLQGGTAEEMAARLGVSANTVKTQLKAVYAKTNTNRQSDVLKLLLALSAA